MEQRGVRQNLEGCSESCDIYATGACLIFWKAAKCLSLILTSCTVILQRVFVISRLAVEEACVQKSAECMRHSRSHRPEISTHQPPYKLMTAPTTVDTKTMDMLTMIIYVCKD